MFAINVISFVCYGLDKHRAVYNKRRISEAMLLLLAFFGAFGALMGMLFFRHKTLKTAFKVFVPIALVLNIIVLYLLGHVWNNLPVIFI